MMEELSIEEQDEEKAIEKNSPSLSSSDDLRELCFLLDAERNKMHELAEQWKQFGTTTIHKLECQIIDYQEKLNELEQRQILLLNENESLKSFINRMVTTVDINDSSLMGAKKINQQNASTQTPERHDSSHPLCFHRPKPISDRASRTTTETKPKPNRQLLMEDPLQQQISIQNMFDAIKTAEVYESIEDIAGDNDESEKRLLKEFCNLIWKYLEDRSKPKSSCLL